MITSDDILEAYKEVDEDVLAAYLFDSNKASELMIAIVRDNDMMINSLVFILKAMSDARRYKLASDIALDKYLAMKKSAEMKDGD